jgi:sRNA-binding protein
MAKPTVKQHLAAIRMLFDWLVTGGILASIKRGKTPVLTTDQARVLIESIDTSTLVGLRDRALIGVMTYAFARIGAVVSMRVEDYFANGKRWWVRLHEKGGKRHEMPAHHKLEAFLDEYLRTAGIAGDEKGPLFRSAVRRTGTLAATAMHRVDAWRMIQRRAAELGMKVKIGCHTFRATGITAYLEAGGTLENAQLMAAHEARARPSSTTAPATRSPLTRSSGLRFEGSDGSGGPQKGQGRPGRTPRRHRAAALATGPLGFYVVSLRSVRAGMISTYRIERDRGSKESAQQLAVLREKWPLAFPVNHQDVRPLAMGVARQVAAAMGWSLPYTLGVLGRWKMAPVYCQAVLCYDQRTTLDGAPAEAVDAEAKDLAAKQLARLAARKATKKAATAAVPAVVKQKPAPSPPTERPPEAPEQLRDRVRAALLRRRA